MHIVWGRQRRHSGNVRWRLKAACVCVSVGPRNNFTALQMHSRTCKHTHKLRILSRVQSARGQHNMGAIKHRPLLSAAGFLWEKRSSEVIRRDVSLYSRKLSFCMCLFACFPFPDELADTFCGTLRACKYTQRSHMMKRSSASPHPNQQSSHAVTPMDYDMKWNKTKGLC